MKLNKLNSCLLLVLATVVMTLSCNKPEKPALGDYPKDANPPGGPLKFYAALDGSAVDSIRANFGVTNNATFGTGVTGMGAQFDGSKNGYISFPSANDFGASTSFTISFWLNITLAQKDNNHAVGIMAFANSNNFWGNATFYADNNAKSPSDSMDLKMHFGAPGDGDNWSFAGYNFNKAWPHMYDGQWHQVAFTYDSATATGTVYRDGVQFDQQSGQTIAFGSASQLIVGGYQEAAGIKGDYAGNTWMAGFPGLIDEVRLYGVALSGADMLALYNSKH